MNLATQPPVLPDLTQKFLKDHPIQIDNLFRCKWKRLGSAILIMTFHINVGEHRDTVDRAVFV